MPELPADAAFASSRDKAEYWIFCAAIFLAFLTNSTTAYFSVILSVAGMSERVIGDILATPAVPVPLAILASGPLIERYSAKGMVLAGQAISLLSFIALQFALPSPLWVAIFRMTLGLGFGLFFPAGMVYARSKLRGPSTPYLFGIYGAMVALPAIVAPAMAEWYVQRYGLNYLFWVMAVPLCVALPIIAALKDTQPSPRSPNDASKTVSYFTLLLNSSLLLPNLSIMVVGWMWGFVASFMSLFLFRQDVPAACFFTSSTATLITSRVLVLRYLSGQRRETVVAAGMVGMALAYMGLSLWTSEAVVIACGMLFGLGYSFTFPVLSVWVSDQFRPDSRGKPVALFGALFHIGIFSLPFMVGRSSNALPLHVVLAVLGAVGIAFSIILAAGAQQRRAPVESAASSQKSPGGG